MGLFLTLLHSERPKLYAVLAFLSAIGLKHFKNEVFSLGPDSFLSLRPHCSIGDEVFYHEVSLQTSHYSFIIVNGAPVAQWVKRWPTDLAVPSSIPAQGEIFSTVTGIPLYTAFHYHLPIVLI